jgi:hypothetical protein
MSAVTLPKRGRGRQSDAVRGHYEEELAAFGAAILQINSKTGFPGQRPWLVLPP